MKLARLTLTSPQLTGAVYELEGVRLMPRTLATWASRGVLVPSVSWPQRRGRYNVREYSLADLMKARLIVRLRREGVAMRRVLAILDSLERELPGALRKPRGLQLEVDGWRGAILRRRGRQLELETGQLRLPFGEIVAGVTQAARRAAGGAG